MPVFRDVVVIDNAVGSEHHIRGRGLVLGVDEQVVDHLFRAGDLVEWAGKVYWVRGIESRSGFDNSKKGYAGLVLSEYKITKYYQCRVCENEYAREQVAEVGNATLVGFCPRCFEKWAREKFGNFDVCYEED